jgi:hypothetical protein
MIKIIQPVDDLPLDAIAFCDLIARIVYRCLKENENRMLLFPDMSEHPSTFLSQEDGQNR